MIGISTANGFAHLGNITVTKAGSHLYRQPSSCRYTRGQWALTNSIL